MSPGSPQDNISAFWYPLNRTPPQESVKPLKKTFQNCAKKSEKKKRLVLTVPTGPLEGSTRTFAVHVFFNLTFCFGRALPQTLCNGDYLRPLRLEVWDWDSDGDHDAMGSVTTNLQSLLEGQGKEMDLEVLRCFCFRFSFGFR